MHQISKLNLPVFAALFLVLVASIITLIQQRGYTIEQTEPFLPNIEGIITDTVAINIDKGPNTLTLVKDGLEDWYVGEMNAYPVDNAKIHTFLEDLQSWKIQGTVTSEPALYDQYGTQNPSAEAHSVRIAFVDINGDTPVNFIVGKTKKDKTFFVRKEGALRVQTIKGVQSFSPTAVFWTDNRLFTVKPENIRTIILTDEAAKPVEKIIFTRKNSSEEYAYTSDFKEDFDFKDKDATKIAQAFSNLHFIDAKPVSEFSDFSYQEIFTLEIQASTGDIYEIKFILFAKDDLWIEVVSSDSKLNAKHQGWLYRLSTFSLQELLPDFEQNKR